MPTSAHPEIPDALTIGQAADVLDQSREKLKRLVTKEHVIPLSGTGGKGGTYRIKLDDLVVLKTVTRLRDLGVPIKAVKNIAGKMVYMIRAGRDRILVYYTPSKNDASEVAGSDVDLLLQNGATVEIVEVKSTRDALQKRIDALPQPKQRGRPREDAAQLRELLEASRDFSADLTPKQYRHLSGKD